MNDNKVKIFEYLDTLVKMCRSKGNGASLIIEEEEIAEQIKERVGDDALTVKLELV